MTSSGNTGDDDNGHECGVHCDCPGIIGTDALFPSESILTLPGQSRSANDATHDDPAAGCRGPWRLPSLMSALSFRDTVEGVCHVFDALPKDVFIALDREDLHEKGGPSLKKLLLLEANSIAEVESFLEAYQTKHA